MTLLANLPLIVPVLNLEIRLEQIDNWQVWSGLAVGDRAAFEDQPALGAMRVGELEEQP